MPTPYGGGSHNDKLVTETNNEKFSNNTPLSYTTIPFLPHIDANISLLGENFFHISFKKFYVTNIHKSGYNKIYENHRSKSFFFEIVDQYQNTQSNLFADIHK